MNPQIKKMGVMFENDGYKNKNAFLRKTIDYVVCTPFYTLSATVTPTTPSSIKLLFDEITTDVYKYANTHLITFHLKDKAFIKTIGEKPKQFTIDSRICLDGDGVFNLEKEIAKRLRCICIKD